ncbi:MAG TPA: cyclic nucleotide-binding domain-containing protein [Terracidiphilus sp.]|nr:cyclic nucleotide-binding domain-containing protein [Terracidiphilus sp.]
MKLDATAFVGDQALVDALRKRSTPVDCGDGRVLFRQGDDPVGMYILHRGEVTMTMHSTEGELLVEMRAGPGSLMGLPGLVGNSTYSLTAEARKGADVSFVTREEFSRLMLSEPGLAMMILRVLAAEVRSARIASQVSPAAGGKPSAAGIPEVKGGPARNKYLA